MSQLVISLQTLREMSGGRHFISIFTQLLYLQRQQHVKEYKICLESTLPCSYAGLLSTMRFIFTPSAYSILLQLTILPVLRLWSHQIQACIKGCTHVLYQFGLQMPLLNHSITRVLTLPKGHLNTFIKMFLITFIITFPGSCEAATSGP